MKYRQGRVNEEMTREMGSILRDVKDYRVTKNFVSITGVDCTADLKYAKVYFSVITKAGDDVELCRRDVSDGLRAASGFIRTQLAQRLNMRQTPELRFYCDTSSEHGARISFLQREIEKKAAELAASTGAAASDDASDAVTSDEATVSDDTVKTTASNDADGE